jgi:carotenoid 1,2-hydratase
VPELPSLGAAPSFPHRWTPLCCPAAARAELCAPGLDFRLEGRGYHDRNSSSVPLPALGIRDWAWGRVSVGDSELVHYLLWSEDVGTPPVQILFEVLPDGSVRHDAAASGNDGQPMVRRPGDELVALDDAWRHPYGVRMHRRITLRPPDGPPIALTADPPVDSGPFYLRYALRDTDGRVCGWGERVKPASVDLPWQRPFVRMRVHGPGADSMWLPLFSGPRLGRVNRLLRSWGQG